MTVHGPTASLPVPTSTSTPPVVVRKRDSRKAPSKSEKAKTEAIASEALSRIAESSSTQTPLAIPAVVITETVRTAMMDRKDDHSESSADASSTTPRDFQERKEEVSAERSPPQRTTITLSAIPVGKLTLKVNSFTSDDQGLFDLSLEQCLAVIGGHQISFSATNKSYNAQKADMDKENVRAQFRIPRNTQKEQYQLITEGYKEYREIFSNRIQALQSAIANLLLESAFLQHILVGNDSYQNPLAHRYGARFRLWEADQAIKTRKSAIGIKDMTSPPADVVIPAPSEVAGDLARISSGIDELKEEVLICNEAFKGDTAGVFANTDLPKNYYIAHKQRLDEIEDAIKIINERCSKRNEELQNIIKLEASTPTSSQSLACKQERLELAQRLSKIRERRDQIQALLAERKAFYRLPEADLDTRVSVSLPTFLNPTYGQALDLMKRIVAFKEEVVLSNQWEHIAPMRQRMAVFFQFSAKADALWSEANRFESENRTARSEMIAASVATYRGYITDMRTKITAIEGHFALWQKDNEERAKWQVDPLPPKAAGGGFFSWLIGSPTSTSTPVPTPSPASVTGTPPTAVRASSDNATATSSSTTTTSPTTATPSKKEEDGVIKT